MGQRAYCIKCLYPDHFFCSLFSGSYRPDFFMPRFYPQNLKYLQQYHRPDRVNPRGDRIEIIFNKNGIEHLPFWSLCNKGNSDNADRSFFVSRHHCPTTVTWRPYSRPRQSVRHSTKKAWIAWLKKWVSRKGINERSHIHCHWLKVLLCFREVLCGCYNFSINFVFFWLLLLTKQHFEYIIMACDEFFFD